jgi:hypothetical protein
VAYEENGDVSFSIDSCSKAIDFDFIDPCLHAEVARFHMRLNNPLSKYKNMRALEGTRMMIPKAGGSQKREKLEAAICHRRNEN